MTRSTPVEGPARLCQGPSRSLARENDPGSDDIMIQRITTHEKALWMLRSFLKN